MHKHIVTRMNRDEVLNIAGAVSTSAMLFPEKWPDNNDGQLTRMMHAVVMAMDKEDLTEVSLTLPAAHIPGLVDALELWLKVQSIPKSSYSCPNSLLDAAREVSKKETNELPQYTERSKGMQTAFDCTVDLFARFTEIMEKENAEETTGPPIYRDSNTTTQATAGDTRLCRSVRYQNVSAIRRLCHVRKRRRPRVLRSLAGAWRSRSR